MGPTRKRDLTAAVVGVAALAYLLVHVLYRNFPPITVWTGLSLLLVALGEAAWGCRCGPGSATARSGSAVDGCIRWWWPAAW